MGILRRGFLMNGLSVAMVRPVVHCRRLGVEGRAGFFLSVRRQIRDGFSQHAVCRGVAGIERHATTGAAAAGKFRVIRMGDGNVKLIIAVRDSGQRACRDGDFPASVIIGNGLPAQFAQRYRHCAAGKYIMGGAADRLIALRFRRVDDVIAPGVNGYLRREIAGIGVAGEFQDARRDDARLALFQQGNGHHLRTVHRQQFGLFKGHPHAPVQLAIHQREPALIMLSTQLDVNDSVRRHPVGIQHAAAQSQAVALFLVGNQIIAADRIQRRA